MVAKEDPLFVFLARDSVWGLGRRSGQVCARVCMEGRVVGTPMPHCHWCTRWLCERWSEQQQQCCQGAWHTVWVGPGVRAGMCASERAYRVGGRGRRRVCVSVCPHECGA